MAVGVDCYAPTDIQVANVLYIALHNDRIDNINDSALLLHRSIDLFMLLTHFGAHTTLEWRSAE